MRYRINAVRVNNANTITALAVFNGTNIGIASATSQGWYGWERRIDNLGATNAQVVCCQANSGTPTDVALDGHTVTYMAVDTTVNENFTVQGQLATASTDWIAIVGGTVWTLYAP
jgi:hypothetical protein